MNDSGSQNRSSRCSPTPRPMAESRSSASIPMPPRCFSPAPARSRSSMPCASRSWITRRSIAANKPARRSSRSTGHSLPTSIRRVVPITRGPDGRLALDGAGTPVEWAVEMRRFDENATLDRLAEAGKIDAALADALGRAVAAAHAGGARGRGRALDRGTRGLYRAERRRVPGDGRDFSRSPSSTALTHGEPRRPRAHPPAPRRARPARPDPPRTRRPSPRQHRAHRATARCCSTPSSSIRWSHRAMCSTISPSC